MGAGARTPTGAGARTPHPSSEMPTGYLRLLPPSKAEHEAEAGSAPWALASWIALPWHPPATASRGHAGGHPIWASTAPGGKLSFGKSLKARLPQRASSPSAVTRWIWYSEFWSIWRRTWCDLQRGKRDRLRGKETKFFPCLCHQPHCCYYSLN